MRGPISGLIAGLALATAGSTTALAAPPGADAAARLFPQRALAAHNRVRAQAGAQPLSWDDALGVEAARYAVVLAMQDRLAHSHASARTGQGENLWMGTRGAFSVEDMIAGWSGERRLFVPGKFPAVSRSGNWSDVGHYSQMVWPTTQKVGCAIASTSSRDVLVCRYFPAGNVIGYNLASR